MSISCMKSFQDVTDENRLARKLQELCGLHIHLHVSCIALCSQLSLPQVDPWYASSISVRGIWEQNCFLSIVILRVLSTQPIWGPKIVYASFPKSSGVFEQGRAWSWYEEGKYQQPLTFKGHFLCARHCAKGFMCLVSLDPGNSMQGKLTT